MTYLPENIINPKNQSQFSLAALDFLINRSIAGIAIIGDDYTIEYVNHIVCEITGLSHNKLLGQDFRNFLHHDDKDQVVEFYHRRRSNESVPDVYELRCARSDGEIRNIIMKTTAISGSNGSTKTVVQVLDITEDKIHRRKLSDRKNCYSILMESVNDGIGIVDSDGYFTFGNKALSEMTGYSQEALCGIHVGDLFQGMSEGRVARRIKDRIEGKSEEYIVHLQNKEGKSRPALIKASSITYEKGQPSQSLVVITDYSIINSIELALQESKLRFQETFRSIPEPAFLWEKLDDGEIVLSMVNRTIQDTTKDTVLQHLGDTVEDVFADSAPIVKAVKNVMKSRCTTSLELPFSEHPGSDKMYRWNISSPTQDLVLMVATDISEIQTVIKQKDQIQERALFYLDVMSHDIGNKLQALRSSAELMLFQTNDSTSHRLLNTILDSITDCEDIISKTKIIEHITLLPLETIDLVSTLKKVVLDMNEKHRDLEIHVDNQNDFLLIKGDQFLDLLFEIILENACEYNSREDKHIWVSLQRIENGIEVSIGDNGIGISDKRKESLFDSIRRFGGLSLHIVRHLLDKYNSSITVKDRVKGVPEEGTVFNITFPESAQ